jgi:hypothetical protein
MLLLYHREIAHAQSEPPKGAQPMAYDKKLVAEKLTRWEHFLGSYHLPAWEELPKIDLYLDQVIADRKSVV